MRMPKKLAGAVLGMGMVACGSVASDAPDTSSAVPGAGPSVTTGAAPKAEAAAAGASAAVPPAAPSTPISTAPTAMTTTSAAPAAPTVNVPTTTTAASQPAAKAGDPITKDCQGFPFENIMYSPGGEILPNKCAPFHATLNNPFAVRCVDVWPWYKTQFLGDAFCILPPEPGKGVQLGHHVQGEYDAWLKAVSQGDMSAYEPSKIPQGWTVAPGAEEERNITIRHMNEGGKYWRTASRMRGGSHHMINSTSESTNTFVWGPGSPDGLFGGTGVPGSQRQDDNSPQAFQIPEEDVGLYRELPANVGVTFNMHHFNATDMPILKEAWVNMWWTENATRKTSGIGGLAVEQALSVFAQPGETVDWHYAIAPPGPLRVLGMFGHRHAWTTNFSAWIERQGKPPELVYQSFDWFDEPTYQYNSQVKNPNPAHTTRSDGGFSGILKVEAGDQIHFNCHIEYTDARAKEVNSPVKPSENGPLRFANQAFTAEMCILWGGVEGMSGTAAKQSAAPPDFAKAH